MFTSTAQGSRLCGFAALAVTFALLALVSFPRRAFGETRSCDGPDSCCPSNLVDHLPAKATVELGVLLVGLHELDERTGTWKADFYLSESWLPKPGFAPRTEIVNEVERQNEQFDITELHAGRCVRSRRIHTTLHSNYNLRRFPFDKQRLTLELSDSWFGATDVGYDSKPSVAELDEHAQTELSSWKTISPLNYARTRRRIRESDGTTSYEYATFALDVRRHVTFHLTRFFLPLFVIVAVALTVFWIDPLDLGSKTSIAVTCLLSAIALQFAEGGTLPEIEYLTLADRVFAACYLALAVALVLTVRSTVLAKRGQLERAHRLDRRGRVALPAGLLLAVCGCIVRAFTA